MVKQPTLSNFLLLRMKINECLLLEQIGDNKMSLIDELLCNQSFSMDYLINDGDFDFKKIVDPSEVFATTNVV